MTNLTREQEIRAEALEQATRLYCKFGAVNKDKDKTEDERVLVLLDNVTQISEVFVDYVTNGVVAEQ